MKLHVCYHSGSEPEEYTIDSMSTAQESPIEEATPPLHQGVRHLVGRQRRLNAACRETANNIKHYNMPVRRPLGGTDHRSAAGRGPETDGCMPSFSCARLFIIHEALRGAGWI